MARENKTQIDVVGLPAFDDNYIWVLRESGCAVVVDPGDAAPVLAHLAATGDALTTAILLTHHHGDHTGGVAELVRHCTTPPVVFGPAKENIAGVTYALSGGERIRPPGISAELEVIAVPGHTLGHIAYFSNTIGNGALFCGDTLFGAGCGRLFEGTAAQMHASLSAIAVLPAPTLVYCAHEYTQNNLHFALSIEPKNAATVQRASEVAEQRRRNLPTVPSTLATELATNPFLRSTAPDVISKAAELLGCSPSNATEVFATIRQARNNFSLSKRASITPSLLVAAIVLGILIQPALAEETPQPAPLTFPAVNPPMELLRTPSQDVRDETPPIPTLDLTTPADDVWQRMRNSFSMPNLEDPLVANRQAWYLNRPDGLQRVFERSRPYLFHIVSELEKRGMPTELALLPMVESSFNPLAYSPARAHGMWQFIPSTGKNYKLQQNAWLDQRRDIVASTNAALDYLQTIYEMHGDWHLALASYNWGEGSVGKAIARNQAQGLPTDYLSIKMPEETRYYVPKLQALKNIVADPELFGIRLDPIPNQAFFGTVELNGDMDVALAAKLAEIPVHEFIALNPAYSRPVIPDSAASPIVLPAHKVETYLSNLERHTADDKPLTSWLTHTLKKGEKIDTIAARYGIDGNKLRRMNGITQRTKVVPGLALLVPGRNTAQPEALLAQLPQTPAQPPRAAKKKAGKGIGKTAGKRTATKGKIKSKSKVAKSQKPRKPVSSKRR